MRRVCALLAGLIVAGLAAAGLPATTPATSAARPIVIGHRGASGSRPEHTLAAYKRAIEAGADFIEPDLVSTKDGALVARHENEISGTTDVASRPEFASRRATKTIDGARLTGWFTEDFTLAELKTLRAIERIPDIRPRNTLFNGMYAVPTLQEVIDLAKAQSAATGRTIGIYPETKHPSYFAAIGLPLEEPLVAILNANGYRDAAAPVFIQSFETANLKRLRGLTGVRLVQLIDAAGQPYDFALAGDPRGYADLITPAGLKEIATYAQGVGANKGLIIPRDSAGRLTRPTALVADAHAAGLLVHAWTFRSENQFLPAELRLPDAGGKIRPQQRGDAAAEYRRFFDAGLDGVFSDHPGAAAHIRNELFR
ncbi:MAG TPA: glycerophosphodiester phosphodiesterase [Herpetosiphonaceae bacterium]